MLIVDTITDDGATHEIMIDTDTKHLFVKLVLRDGYEVIRQDDEYPNLSMLSANLVAEIMYGPAVELLTKHNVPHDSPLWDLNHRNPWK